MKVIYQGRAHRLVVGSTVLNRGEEVEVSEDVFSRIKDRGDIRLSDEAGHPSATTKEEALPLNPPIMGGK